jgi:hypothetical protein
MLILHLVLLALLLAAWRILLVLFRPFKKHGRCAGRGCKRCSGGRKRRLGAKRVARAYQSARAAISDRLGGDS